jgi:hypothetical protein
MQSRTGIIQFDPMPEDEGKVSQLDERVRHAEAALDPFRQLLDSLMKIATMRTSFFEKLMLLAAGSFALTLTLLAFLRSHAAPNQPLASLVYLKTAWGLMLTSILFGGLHNYFVCNMLYKMSFSVANTAQMTGVAILGSFLSDIGEDASDLSEMRAKSRKVSKDMAVSASQTQNLSSALGILSMWLNSFFTRVASYLHFEEQLAPIGVVFGPTKIQEQGRPRERPGAIIRGPIPIAARGPEVVRESYCNRRHTRLQGLPETFKQPSAGVAHKLQKPHGHVPTMIQATFQQGRHAQPWVFFQFAE